MATIEEVNDALKRLAEETGREISELSKNVSETGKHVDEVGKHVDDLTKTVHETRRELSDLAKHVEEVGKHVEEVGKHVEEVGKHVDDVGRHVDEVGRHVEELTQTVNETTKDVSDLTKTLNRWAGRFGNTIGYITEMILVPGIGRKMSEHGHSFKSLAARKEFYRKDGSIFTEVDLILENDAEVMIVEIKTHLTTDEVQYQVKRLQRLRKGEKEAKIEDKSLIAAVAGLSIDEDARKTAKKLGMYVIEMVEDDKNITIDPPDGAVGRW